MEDQTFKIVIIVITSGGSLILLLGTALLVVTKKTIEDKVDQLMILYAQSIEEVKSLTEDMSELKPIVRRNKEDIQGLWKKTSKGK